MNAESTERSCGLKSELGRLCLPAATLDVDRNFAWMNSICIMFLLIGVFGRPAGAHVRPVSPVEEIIPTIIEQVPAPPPPPVTGDLKLDHEERLEKPEVALQVVVTPDAPDINFAVPTIGNLLVPAAMAVAPPLRPMTAPLPAPVVVPGPVRPAQLADTGVGGDCPQPPYPLAALKRQQQGTVVLYLTGDEDGNIAAVHVKVSSGHPVLDKSTIDFVKRNWRMPRGSGNRVYIATVRYRLEGE